jgi:hypothetical protein
MRYVGHMRSLYEVVAGRQARKVDIALVDLHVDEMKILTYVRGAFV